MSLYNMLFGTNDNADLLLACLGFKSTSEIPRFRDCFILNNTICIHTRTGGGNRDYYENEQTCRENYPEHFDLKYLEDLGTTDGFPNGPWNDGLRSNPNYLTDYDDDFDCTYANFIFKFPEEYEEDLKAMAAENKDYKPSEKWKLLFKSMETK